jgi:hypothetical protein
MKRRLFNLAAAVSLLLCVGTILAAAATRARPVSSQTGYPLPHGWLLVYLTESRTLLHVAVVRARVEIGVERAPQVGPPDVGLTLARWSDWFVWASDVSPGDPSPEVEVVHLGWAGAGFALHERAKSTDRSWNLRLPCWLIVCATLMLPSIWAASHLRRRNPRGTCASCG